MLDDRLQKMIIKDHQLVQLKGEREPHALQIEHSEEYRKPFMPKLEKVVLEHAQEHIFNSSQVKKLKEEFTSTIEVKFKQFPFCCEHHEKLLNKKEFSALDYQKEYKKVVEKALYLYAHYVHYIGTNDWERKIIEYYEYVVCSLGKFPAECGETYGIKELKLYFYRFIIEVEHIDKPYEKYKDRSKAFGDIIDERDKKEELLNKQYPESYKELSKTYTKWKQSIPFDYTLLSHLKKDFPDQFAFYNYKRRFNQYLQIEFIDLILPTKENLIQLLVQLTKSIISSYDFESLYKRDEINIHQVKELDLYFKEHKIEQQELLENYHKQEVEYTRILKTWMKNEIKLVTRIKQYENSMKQVQNQQTFQPPKVKVFEFKDFNINQERISDLRNGLELKNFIAKYQTQPFRKIFSGGAHSDIEPVKWKGTMAELSYFIKRLHNHYKLIKDTKRKHWKMAVNLFVDEKRRPFKVEKLRNQKPPARATLINKLLQDCKDNV